MRKFELSIDVNYVGSWGIVEAVREFFQNAYDEEKDNPDNKSFFEYDPETQIIRIGNKSSVLKSETLLLGCTSKASDKDTIGQFGEGYKIATVVALRTNHPVTIYNYGAREIWNTRLVKSRRYNGRLVPTFFISKEFDWSSFFRKSNLEEKNLIIEIQNVTQEEYDKIVESNLNLQDLSQVEIINTNYGDIIKSEEYIGKVYVGGLYVYTDSTIKYGYNIKPAYLPLDRDRMAVSSFDLLYVTSKMWIVAIVNEKIDLNYFVDILEKNINDLSYVHYVFDYVTQYNNREDLVAKIYKKFIEKYGKVVPVDSESMRQKLKLSDNEVAYVGSEYYYLLNRYRGEDAIIVKTETYFDRYKKLLNSLREFMTPEQIEEADYLLEHTMYTLGGESD